jgi:hypothetical protein
MMIELKPRFTNQALSGERVPSAYRKRGVDPRSIGPSDSIIENVDTALPRLLSMFHHCLGLPDIGSVVDVCLEKLRLGDQHSDPAALLMGLYRQLLKEDDVEGYIVTTALFARLHDTELADLPTRDFLVETARRYCYHTAHLFPLLHEQASAALTTCKYSNRSRIRLFLRDALVFWPSLVALRPRIFEIPLDFLVFTRSLKNNGHSPIVFSDEGDGVLRRSVEVAVPRTLILDVGLYGTLVKQLDGKGFFAGDGSVMFLGSRNPHIAGFLNQLRSHGESTETVMQQRDVIRYVDTVECLLKPFLLPASPCSNDVFVELGDGISFVCSVVFLWSLYHYSVQADKFDSAESAAEALLPKLLPENQWLLHEPIPAWTKAKDFLAGWSVRDLMSGIETREYLDRWRRTEP